MVLNQKENKITALYLRVSKDDLKRGKVNESNSISNTGSETSKNLLMTV